MKITLTLTLLAAMLSATPAAAQQTDARTAARIERILKATPLIDGHNDLPWELRENHKSDISGLESGREAGEKPLMTDIARLRRGRVGGQFWSVYISGTLLGDEAVRVTLEQIDTARRLIAAYPRDLELAATADDMVRIHRSGRIGSLLGMEGGRQLGGSMAALRQFYALGVRYMTLTHNQTTEWADSATDVPKHGGLSPFGEQVVAEMNRLGMLVDLSHVSSETALDAIGISRAPVIFSHSNAMQVAQHPRNVSDQVLQRVAANGGVVMVNFYPVFLAQAVRQWNASRAGEEARLKSLYPYDPKLVADGVKRWEAANPRPRVTVAAVADHIEHIARVASHDNVGLGADFDGVPFTVEGLEGVDDYPVLFAELIRRGWSDRNLAKLAGGNVLRALRQAEAVAASMKDVPPSMATLETSK